MHHCEPPPMLQTTSDDQLISHHADEAEVKANADDGIIKPNRHTDQNGNEIGIECQDRERLWNDQSQPASNLKLRGSDDITMRYTDQDETGNDPESQPVAIEDEAVSLVAKVIIKSAISLAAHLNDIHTALAIKISRESAISRLIAWAGQLQLENQLDAHNLSQLHSIIFTTPETPEGVEVTYARLCQKLLRLNLPRPSQREGITHAQFQVFLDCLTQHCQECVAKEWSRSMSRFVQSSSSLAQSCNIGNVAEGITILDEAENVNRFPTRCRIFIGFVVELFKQNMLTNITVSNCLSNSLFLNLEALRDGEIAFLCHLMMEAGIKLDQDSEGRLLMDAHIARMISLANKRHLSIESRLMIHNVIHSRRYQWAPCRSIDVPSIVNRVKSLLTGMDETDLHTTSDQIIAWADESEYEQNALRQVIILIFDKAGDNDTSAELCAKLCQRLMVILLRKIQDIQLIDAEQYAAYSYHSFRDYILHRVQEDHQKESRWALSAFSSDPALNDQSTVGGVSISHEIQLVRKSRRLSFFYFLGELFRYKVVTAQAVHERIQGLLWHPQGFTEEDVECLGILLKSIGNSLDHEYMRLILTRISEILHSEVPSVRAHWLLQDTIYSANNLQECSSADMEAYQTSQHLEVEVDTTSQNFNVEVDTTSQNLKVEEDTTSYNWEAEEDTTSRLLIYLLTTNHGSYTSCILTPLSDWINLGCLQRGDIRIFRDLIALVFQLAIHTTLKSLYAGLFKFLMHEANFDNGFDHNGQLLTGVQLYVKYIFDRAHYEFERLWNLAHDSSPSEDCLLWGHTIDLSQAMDRAEEYLEIHGPLPSKGQFRYPKLSDRSRDNFIKFLLKLHEFQVLTEEMIHGFIGRLLQIPSPDTEDVDCLYQLLILVKGDMSHCEAGGYVKNHTLRMKELARDVQLSIHARLAILKITKNHDTPALCDLDEASVLENRVQSLLTVMDESNLETISDEIEIVAWSDKSQDALDGRLLCHITNLIFDKAIEDDTSAELCAKLCQMLMENLQCEVYDDRFIDHNLNPLHSNHFFHTYLLHQIQADHQAGSDHPRSSFFTAPASKDPSRGWDMMTPDQNRIGRKPRRLGFFYFIGELFKCKVITEQVIHQHIQGILRDPQRFEEEDIECLCVLLKSIGDSSDHNKSAECMDSILARISEILRSGSLSEHAHGLFREVISRQKNVQETSSVDLEEDTTSRLLIYLLTTRNGNYTSCILTPLLGWINSERRQQGHSRTLGQLTILVFQLAIHATSHVSYAALFQYLLDHGCFEINVNNGPKGNADFCIAHQLPVKYILDRADYEFAELWGLRDSRSSTGDHLLSDRSQFDLTKAMAGAQEYLERHGPLRSKGRFQYPKLDDRLRYNFIKFLHQLCKSRVLSEGMIHSFIVKLFQVPSPDEEDVDCLHHLLSLVKEQMRPCTAEGYVKNHFARMEELATDVKLSFHAQQAIMQIFKGDETQGLCDSIEAPGIRNRVQSLLTVMDESNFKSTSDEIASWANNSVNKEQGQMLCQIITRIFDAAVEDDQSAELCAKLCQRLMENFLAQVQHIQITGNDQDTSYSYHSFRDCIHHRVQEDHQIDSDTARSYQLDINTRRLGFFYFLGELFKCKVITQQAMHERIQFLLGDSQGGTDENMECLYNILRSIGESLDHGQSAYMDPVFGRICEIVHSGTLSERVCELLQEVPSTRRTANVESEEDQTSHILFYLLRKPGGSVPPVILSQLSDWITLRCMQQGDNQAFQHLIFLIFQLAIHTTTQPMYAVFYRDLIQMSSLKIKGENGNVNLDGHELHIQYVIDRAHHEFEELWNLEHTYSLQDRPKFDLKKAMTRALEYHKEELQYPKLSGQYRSNFIRFILKLYKHRVLTEATIHDFTGKLFKISSPDEEDLDCLYRLLRKVKGKLHCYEADGYIKRYLPRMKKLAGDKKLGHHARCAILEIIKVHEQKYP